MDFRETFVSGLWKEEDNKEGSHDDVDTMTGKEDLVAKGPDEERIHLHINNNKEIYDMNVKP